MSRVLIAMCVSLWVGCGGMVAGSGGNGASEPQVQVNPQVQAKLGNKAGVKGGQQSYVEFNAGIAFISDPNFSHFPGASFLVGKRYDQADGNLMLEMELGLAFPTIATAKIGGDSI